MEISDAKFEERKEKSKEYYLGIGKIVCPYFNNDFIHFSASGYQHILYKGSSKIKARTRQEQFIRLGLLKNAVKLLALTATVQEIEENSAFVKVKKNKRKEMILTKIKYWGFIAILDGKKIKVIVKQTGEGFKQFWSIIPNWTTRKSREAKMVKN